MNRPFHLLALLPACALLAPAFAQQPAATQSTGLRKLPPETIQRASAFRQALQPSARAWVQQQARTQAGHAADVAAIRASARQRFAPSAGAKNFSDSDIDALVMVVLEQTAESDQQDLQQMMQDQAAINEAKAQLRGIEQQANQMAASAQPGKATEPCRLPACEALPAQLKQLSSSPSLRQHPIRATIPPNATYKQIAAAASQIQKDLDSLGDMSQEMQTKMQMAQDQYSKLMEALSNLLKSANDTQTNIIANMK